MAYEYEAISTDERRQMVDERLRTLESEHWANSLALQVAKGNSEPIAPFEKNLRSIEGAIHTLVGVRESFNSNGSCSDPKEVVEAILDT